MVHKNVCISAGTEIEVLGFPCWFFPCFVFFLRKLKGFWGFLVDFFLVLFLRKWKVFSWFLFEAGKTFNHFFHPNFSLGRARNRIKLGNYVL